METITIWQYIGIALTSAAILFTFIYKDTRWNKRLGPKNKMKSIGYSVLGVSVALIPLFFGPSLPMGVVIYLLPLMIGAGSLGHHYADRVNSREPDGKKSIFARSLDAITSPAKRCKT